MLLTKDVELSLHGKNIKRYEDLGYEIPRYKNNQGKLVVKKGTTITIDIKDLSEGSGHIVDIQCDYCGKIIQRKYNEYVARRNGFEKDSCSECRYDKIREVNKISAKSVGDNGYWQIKENIISEFIKYINTHKDLSKMRKINPQLESSMYSNGYYKYELLEELGYSVQDYTTRNPNGWYDDFNRLSKDIMKIANKYGSFPSHDTVIKELKISNNIFKKHGGYKSIRKRLDGNCSYLDRSGFYNSSFYEVIVANFLFEILPHGSYKREVLPFPNEGQFRCDFYFKHKDKEYYCEVWGYDDRDASVNKKYNAVRKIKEDLYKKYSLNLISINGWIFDKMKYEDIVIYLNGIFKKIINSPLKQFKSSNIIPAGYLTDNEILSKIEPYIQENMFPSQVELSENGLSGYYREIVRRHDNLLNFAKKYGLDMKIYNNGYWSVENIDKYFDYMLEKYKRFLSCGELKKENDKKMNKFYSAARRLGYISLQIGYLKRKQDIRTLSNYEEQWLNEIIHSNKHYVSDKHKKQAKFVLLASA